VPPPNRVAELIETDLEATGSEGRQRIIAHYSVAELLDRTEKTITEVFGAGKIQVV